MTDSLDVHSWGHFDGDTCIFLLQVGGKDTIRWLVLLWGEIKVHWDSEVAG